MNIVSKLFASTVILFSANSQAITIDGKLGDWIGTPAGNSNDWKPKDSSVNYVVEDQNTDFLSPGYGGQNYDAEAIYIKSDALNFYVAVVTGLSSSNTVYPAGDLAFDFGKNGSYEYGVVVKSDAGLHSNGGIGNQGEVYKVSQWNYGLWDVNGNPISTSHKSADTLHPTTIKEGVKKIGTDLADVVYSNNPITLLGALGGNHYVIEARISKSVFSQEDLAQSFNLHWTMACANDSILVDPSVNVPTPTVLPMLALGMSVLFRIKKRNISIAKSVGY